MEGKLTVEQAHRQVKEDWRRIRRKLGLKGHELNHKKCVGIIEKFGEIMKEKNRQYSRYEIGHVFNVRHVISKAKKEIGLSGREKKLVETALGRLYYNVPKREYERRLKAQKKIMALRERGNKISAFVATEYDNLLGMANAPEIATDIFANPMEAHYPFRRKTGFGIRLLEQLRNAGTSDSHSFYK